MQNLKKLSQKVLTTVLLSDTITYAIRKVVRKLYKIDVNKLQGKRVEKGYNLTSFADAIGVSRVTLHKYLDEPDKIPYSALTKMACILCDNELELQTIFFAQ